MVPALMVPAPVVPAPVVPAHVVPAPAVPSQEEQMLMARIKEYLAAFGGRVAIEELGTDFGTPFNTHVRKNTGRNDGAFRKWLGAAAQFVVKPSLRVRNK